MGFLKKPNSETLQKRAHLGTITTANELIKLAKELSIKTSPIDVKTLASNLGIRIEEVDLPEKHSGSLSRDNDGVWVCKVNQNHHSTRKRFTIAHEIGHYILHRNDKDTFDENVDPVVRYRAEDVYSNEDEASEIEANRFASELLMPEDDFRAAFLISDIAEVSKSFCVSLPAAKVRANLLGIRYDS